MSAPQSDHQQTRAALLEVYQILRGAAQRAREARQHAHEEAAEHTEPATSKA